MELIFMTTTRVAIIAAAVIVDVAQFLHLQFCCHMQCICTTVSLLVRTTALHEKDTFTVIKHIQMQISCNEIQCVMRD